MIKNFVKILELLGDRLEVCVSVLCQTYQYLDVLMLHFRKMLTYLDHL